MNRHNQQELSFSLQMPVKPQGGADMTVRVENDRIAKEWREEWDRVGSGGVVVIYQGEANGWMNELRDPQGWAPGCIAVSESGEQWEAIGGNDYDGAESWQLLTGSESQPEQREAASPSGQGHKAFEAWWLANAPYFLQSHLSASRVGLAIWKHQQAEIDRLQSALSFTFQGPAHCAPIPALEGLFTTLSQRLERLPELRTDLPGDYVDRCKSAFTDALLNELERQGYHSPAFERLIRLRDAYDAGALDHPPTMENDQ